MAGDTFVYMGKATMTNNLTFELYGKLFAQVPWSESPYNNQTTNWHPSDSEESFHRMMQDPIHREYFAKKGWDQPGTITYSFNSNGYRSGEFDTKADNLVALGCSFTMGIGLPVQDVWPSRVGQALNLQVCNFGWGGGSSDRCYRLAQYWVPHLRPKLVVLLNPPRGRLEVIIDDITGKTEQIADRDFEENMFLKKWISADTNQILNNQKNSRAISTICAELNIPFLSYEADTWMSGSREALEYARDYMHAGPRGHEILAERIINDFATK